MGNALHHQQSAHARQEVSRVSALYRNKFSHDEMFFLKKVFDDLAKRSPDWVVEKEHFSEYIMFPGLHGDQVFQAFDTKNTGNLDFEEFVAGLARSARGTKEEKVRFLFKVYDLKKDGFVSKGELQKMINMIPREKMHRNNKKANERVRSSFGVRDHRLKTPTPSPPPPSSQSPATPPRALSTSSVEDSPLTRGSATHRFVAKQEVRFHEYTNDEFVDEAFAGENDGRLNYEQFKVWIHKRPEALEFVEEILEKAIRAAGTPAKTKPMIERSQTSDASFEEALSLTRTKSDEMLMLPYDSTKFPKYSGVLKKKGQKTNHFTTRYFVLVGNCLYYFVHRTDHKPRGLIFLGGCKIEQLPTSYDATAPYGFRIVHLDSERLGKRPHTLFAASAKDRDDWIDALCASVSRGGGGEDQQGVFDVTKRYELGEELGSGRFAIARTAVDKSTGAKVAVKSIEKRQQEDQDLGKTERDMFRREIAVMRLAAHCNVLPLLAVFEDRKHVHLVMPLMKCDLATFVNDRMEKGNPTTEKEAAVCFPVILNAVAYLHHLGVAHRDLKPDNILMEDDQDLTKLRLADFSISQILKPDELIHTAQGSIEYMAPEVFLRKGSSFPADVWALGVIAFVVVFNRQPFGGDSKGETIGYILEKSLQLAEDPEQNDLAWEQFCTPSCRDLIENKMLQLDPEKRITAKDALETHPWVLQHADVLKSINHPSSVAQMGREEDDDDDEEDVDGEAYRALVEAARKAALS